MVPQESLAYKLGESVGLVAGELPWPVVLIFILQQQKNDGLIFNFPMTFFFFFSFLQIKRKYAFQEMYFQKILTQAFLLEEIGKPNI